MTIDRDAGECELSLALIRDQVENVGAERFKDGLAVFAHQVSVGASCKGDSKVRG